MPVAQTFPQLALPANYEFGDSFTSQDIRVTKNFEFKERYKTLCLCRDVQRLQCCQSEWLQLQPDQHEFIWPTDSKGLTGLRIGGPSCIADRCASELLRGKGSGSVVSGTLATGHSTLSRLNPSQKLSRSFNARTRSRATVSSVCFPSLRRMSSRAPNHE